MTFGAGNVLTAADLDARFAPISQGSRVGYVSYATNQTGIGSSDTGLTGLGITLGSVAARRYQMHYSFCVTQVTSNGAQTFQWSLAGVGQAIIDIEDSLSGATRMVSGFIELGVLGAGVKSIGLLGRTNAGTMTIQNGSYSPGRLSIIDVGT